MKYIVIDSDGNEHTEPLPKEEAKEMLERAKETGTLDYSLKQIGRGFM